MRLMELYPNTQCTDTLKPAKGVALSKPGFDKNIMVRG